MKKTILALFMLTIVLSCILMLAACDDHTDVDEPLMIGSTMIGALGVSGASAAEDSELAAFGAAALKEVITCL